MSAEIPVAGRLSAKQRQARRKNYLDKAAESLIDSAELSDGFVFRFPRGESILQRSAEIIYAEQKCCPFLNFRLALNAGDDFVSLGLTGAEGTKKVTESLFNRN